MNYKNTIFVPLKCWKEAGLVISDNGTPLKESLYLSSCVGVSLNAPTGTTAQSFSIALTT